MKLRFFTSSSFKPITAFCIEGLAARKCGLDAMIGNGLSIELQLTKQIIIKNIIDYN